MIDDIDMLETVLADYEPASFGERQVLGGAREALRAGVEPAEVLMYLDGHRELIDEWTALEREAGIAGAWKRWCEELQERWKVIREGEAALRDWDLAHPVCACGALARLKG